jgi:hypothetical protein
LGGYFVCSSLSLFVPPFIAIIICIAVGWAKEMWDKRGNGTYEELDFLATALGGILYLLLLYVKGVK